MKLFIPTSVKTSDPKNYINFLDFGNEIYISIDVSGEFNLQNTPET
jgi:hypothetical protein